MIHRRAEQPKKRVTNQRTFELELNESSLSHLSYFVKQELAYYNQLVESMTPRLRAFPQELISMKDREKRLLEVCAEHAIDPQKMMQYGKDEWPEHLKQHWGLVKEQDGSIKITPAHANVIAAVAAPARLHGMVRRNMAAEMFRYMSAQAEIIQASTKLAEGLKAPLQMLQKHTLETKRHLQIPGRLTEIAYNQDQDRSEIRLPYCKQPVVVNGYDLSEIPHRSIIIRMPHPTNGDNRWFVDFRDSDGYSVSLTDPNDRRRRM